MKIVKGREDLDKDLGQIQPENLNVVVYANRLRVGGKNGSLFEENTYVLLYVKNDTAQLLEGYGISKTINTDIVSEVTQIDGTKMRLQNHTTWKVMVDYNPSQLFSKEVDLFTFGKPLDIDEANNGDQEVYVSRETIPSKINQDINYNFIASPELQEVLMNMDNVNNMTKLDLINISLVNNIANSAIVYLDNVMENKSDYRVNRINIGYDKSFALLFNDGIIINGVENDTRRRIFLETIKDGKDGTNTFTPLSPYYRYNLLLTKIVPIADNGGIIAINETNDFNLNLPLEILKLGTSVSTNLRDAIIGTSTEDWKKDLYKSLLGSLELTRAYGNYFTDYIKTGTDGKVGIDPDATIDGKKIGLLGGTNSTDAVSSVDGLLTTFDSTHPDKIDTNEYKFVKACQLYLSPWIQSSNALGKGLNKLNRIYQLFYFDLLTAINKGFADSDTQALNVITKSLYFDFDKLVKPYKGPVLTGFPKNPDTDTLTSNIFLKEKLWNYTRPKMFDIDGNISLAPIPKQWTALNRPARAGDVNISSDDLSRYYFYLPAHKWQTDAVTRYYGQITKTTSNQDVYQEKVIIVKYGTVSVETTNVPENEIKTNLENNIMKEMSVLNKMSPADLFANFLSKNIPSTENIQIVNNQPRVEIYKTQITGIKTVGDNLNARQTSLQTGFISPTISGGRFTERREAINPDAFGPISFRIYKSDTYDLNIQIRYWSKVNIPTSLDTIVSNDPLITKGDYVDIVTALAQVPTELQQYEDLTLLTQDFGSDLDNMITLGGLLDVPSPNSGGNTVNDIEQIMLNGLWGETFSICIGYLLKSDETQPEVTIKVLNLPFLASRDETITTTKVNF